MVTVTQMECDCDAFTFDCTEMICGFVWVHLVMLSVTMIHIFCRKPTYWNTKVEIANMKNVSRIERNSQSKFDRCYMEP